MASTPKAFLYKSDTYIKIIPCKRLFNSTTVHEVVTRGSFFALNLKTGIFTVIPGDAELKPAKVSISYQAEMEF